MVLAHFKKKLRKINKKDFIKIIETQPDKSWKMIQLSQYKNLIEFDYVNLFK